MLFGAARTVTIDETYVNKTNKSLSSRSLVLVGIHRPTPLNHIHIDTHPHKLSTTFITHNTTQHNTLCYNTHVCALINCNIKRSPRGGSVHVALFMYVLACVGCIACVHQRMLRMFVQHFNELFEFANNTISLPHIPPQHERQACMHHIACRIIPHEAAATTTNDDDAVVRRMTEISVPPATPTTLRIDTNKTTITHGVYVYVYV